MDGMYEIVDHYIRAALREDVGTGDVTTEAIIPPSLHARGWWIAKEEGVVAGVAFAEQFWKTIDASAIVEPRVRDGDAISPGTVIMGVRSRAQTLLIGERTMLNIVQYMSGIATNVRRMVDAIRDTGAVLLDTRKVLPMHRTLAKWAVRIGGGQNYRMGLYDRYFIKNNHIDLCGGIPRAIEAVHRHRARTGSQLPITIEVRNFDELEEVLQCGGVDRILLDNFDPPALRQAVQRVDGRFETEASGGIHLGNVRAYALTGVDYISSGSLTHSVQALDMHFRIEIS